MEGRVLRALEVFYLTDPPQRVAEEWVGVQGGTGAIHMQVSFKPAQVS